MGGGVGGCAWGGFEGFGLLVIYRGNGRSLKALMIFTVVLLMMTMIDDAGADVDRAASIIFAMQALFFESFLVRDPRPATFRCILIPSSMFHVFTFAISPRQTDDPVIKDSFFSSTPPLESIPVIRFLALPLPPPQPSNLLPSASLAPVAPERYRFFRPGAPSGESCHCLEQWIWKIRRMLRLLRSCSAVCSRMLALVPPGDGVAVEAVARGCPGEGVNEW